MEFNYILLGENLGKTEEGFSGHGDWTCYKLFLGDSEFYLNLNRKRQKGELICRNLDRQLASQIIAQLQSSLNSEHSNE